MPTFLQLVFWISVALIFYNYAGYALLVFLFNQFKKNPVVNNHYHPSVSFIVAAYNEEDCIEQKIINSLNQDYPADKIEFIFITDGSTDRTPDIIRSYPAIRLMHQPSRSGKTAALNRAVASANHEILIFSDANTLLNPEACRNIARHYLEPGVGGVAGEKKVVAQPGSANATDSEGFYWKYESLLKRLDSRFHTVVGAAGELFSVRSRLYEPVSAEVILDDFIISMKIAQQGYRIVYEPDAYAMELPSPSMGDEKKRKVRIAAGGFQSMVMLPQSLRFWKHPKLSFLYLSHRIMRWTTSPLGLVFALLSNAVLCLLDVSPLYRLLFLFQILFYGGALAYAYLPFIRKKVSLLKLPYYFIFMNVSVFQGFFKFLQKKQSSVWEKASRTKQSLPQINR